VGLGSSGAAVSAGGRWVGGERAADWAGGVGGLLEGWVGGGSTGGYDAAASTRGEWYVCFRGIATLVHSMGHTCWTTAVGWFE